MDELKKLYDILVRDGYYTKSFEEFQSQWGDQTYKDKVYSIVSRDGLYTKDKDSFFQKYSGQTTPAPTAEQPTPDELKKKEQSVTTASPSDAASLGLPTEFPKPQDLPMGQGKPFKMDLSGIQPKETALDEFDRRAVKANTDYESYSIVNAIDPDKYLNEVYGGAGFKFKRERGFNGLSDNIIATSPNGQEITIAINNFKFGKNQAELERLQNFIRNSPKAEGQYELIKEGKAPSFSKSINVITPELISGTEEKAVPLMNYHFGELGFKFEESGMTGDFMTVTAPDGTQMEVSLDNWTSDKDKSQAEKLQKFITQKSNAQSVTEFEAKTIGANAKITTDKEVKDSVSAISKDVNALVQERIALNQQYELLTNVFSQLEAVPETKRDASWIEKYNQANSEKQSIADQAAVLEEKRSNIETKDAQLQAAAGRYYTMKGEQGTWYGNIWNEFKGAFGEAGAGRQNLKFELARKIPYVDDIIMAVNYGPLNRSTEYKDKFIEIAKEMKIQIPEGIEGDLEKFNDWKNSLAFGDVRRKEIEDKILNATIRSNKEGISETVIKGYSALNDPNTTVEYTDFSKKGFWGGAIASLINFAPAMIGTPINKAATMFAMSNENMQKEFNSNPAFKDVSETDKMIYALPFNLANSVLLEFGLNKIMANKSFVTDLVNSSLKMVGAKATAAELKSVMKGEVNNFLARGGITMVKGALGGAELGAAMHVSDEAIREFYNNVSGKEMLRTPESVTEFLRETGEAMASMAVGGAILTVPRAINAAATETGYKGMSNEQFQMFESAANNSDLQTAFVTNLKNKVVSGEITTEQAKETLNNYRNSVGLFRSLPEGLDIFAKKEAMDLLKEKRDLENKIKDKDAALVKPQQERINKINEQLTKLSEDAIQKQKSDEALLRAGEERLGLSEMGEGDTQLEVTTGEEAITPEGTEKVGTYEYEGKKYSIDKDGVVIDIERDSMVPADLADKIKSKGKLIESAPKVVSEVTAEEKTTLQQATEARKAAKARLDSLRQGFGINSNAKLEALVDYHQSLVKEAKEFIKEKKGDIKEWAKSIGHDVNRIVKKAWDEASGLISPIQKAEELEYTFDDAFGVDVKSLPGYEKQMEAVDFIIEDNQRYKNYIEDALERAKKSGRGIEKAQKAVDEYQEVFEKTQQDAIDELQKTDLYKNASDIQKEELVRDVIEKFGLKEKKAPSPEKLLGEQKPEKVVTTTKEIIKNRIQDLAKGSKEGAKAVKDAVKQIVDYVKTTKLNTGDLKKIMDIISKSKIETEEGLNKAIEKIFEVVDKSDADLVEVSKTKMGKAQLKAGLKAAREAFKGFKEAKKKIQEYFESVKEYGNLTRKDLAKIAKEMMKVKDEKTLNNAVEKINKIIDNAKTDIIEISEYNMLREMLSAIKEAKGDLKERRKILDAAIANIEKAGTLTAKQVGSLIKKLNKVNVESDVEMEKVIEYAEKLFNDAEYDSKLKKGSGIREAIKKLSKNPLKAENLTALGKYFAKIKPSMVEDIDMYNEMAAKVKEAIKGSTLGKEEINEAEMVKVAEVKEYIDEMLTAQEEAMERERIATEEEIVGEDMSEMTEAERERLLEEKKTIIKNNIKDRFNGYVQRIREALETGIDPATGDSLDVSDSKKELVKRFMGMDTDLLSPKDALAAIDSLKNFLANGSTASMETIVSKYQYTRNAEMLADQGFHSKELQYAWVKSWGRLLGEQFMTIPMLIERMFGGTVSGGKFSKYSGFTELKNQKTLAQYLSTNVKNEYINQFFKRKANGKDFNTSENNIERGMLAAVKRTIMGTPEEQQAEFKRKKDLIDESIKELKTGTEEEKQLAELYETVYDKILKDSNTITDVISKVDGVNLEAVNFWVKKWSDIYDQLADISESIYNKKLDKDIDYNPDVLRNLFNRGGSEEIGDEESLFHGGTRGVYERRTGVLEENQRITNLPKNDASKKVERYLDLSFDRNNTNAYYDALMDIYTSATVRGVKAFFTSKAFDEIVPYARDRAILYNSSKNAQDQGAIQRFIRTIRSKDIVSNDEASRMMRKFNSISKIGTAAVLAGGFQLFKQTVPVGANTIINTGGKLDVMGSMFDKAKNDFLDRIGYGISVRGVESLANVESLNKMVENNKKSFLEKQYFDRVENLNDKMLRLFLVAPDRFIARASWLSYYEAGLRKQGIDPKTFDYSRDKVNKEAADYAQSMVDRQQNISDADLQGKWLGAKDTKAQIFNKLIIPFASFRINQTMRMLSDLSTLSKNSVATAEDRAIAKRSLAGYLTEAVIFRTISGMASVTLGNWAKDLLGQKESDEDKKKRKGFIIKTQVTGAVTDLAPLPFLEYPLAVTVDEAMNAVQKLAGVKEEDIEHLFTGSRQDVYKTLGAFGILPKKIDAMATAMKLKTTGKFKDEYGREKYISKKDREALGKIVAMSLANTFVAAPSEINTIINNSIKFVKKNASDQKGGKSESDIKLDEEVSSRSEEKKEESESVKLKKIDAINELIEKERNKYNPSDEKISAMQRMILELKKTKEEKKEESEDRKRSKLQEDKKMEDLLQGYDSKSDMKRYDPILYKKTFGKNSDYYKEHKDEVDAENELDELLQKKEDKERDYSAPIKKEKAGFKSNTEWSDRSSSFTKTVRDAQGNLIRSFKKTKKW